jgi:hypothetical protein
MLSPPTLARSTAVLASPRLSSACPLATRAPKGSAAHYDAASRRSRLVSKETLQPCEAPDRIAELVDGTVTG